MKYTILFFMCVVLGFLFVGGISFFSSRHSTLQFRKMPITANPTFSPEIPPKESLEGILASVSGSVLWQSRVATVSSSLGNQTTIHQGESLQTGPDGFVMLVFSHTGHIILFSDTLIDIVQTIPAHMVFTQETGLAEYVADGSQPFSVRVQHLAVEQSAGSMAITSDTTTHMVTVKVLQGQVIAGFNDLKNTTQTVSCSAGHEIFFDDDARMPTVRKVK